MVPPIFTESNIAACSYILYTVNHSMRFDCNTCTFDPIHPHRFLIECLTMSNKIVFLNSWLLFKCFWKIFSKFVDFLFVASSYQYFMFIHIIRRSLPSFVKNLGRFLKNILITLFASSDNTSMVWSNKESTRLIIFPFLETSYSKLYFPSKDNSRNIKTSITFLTFHC